MSYADTFLVGSVCTVDPSRPRAEALAIKDGRILAVGAASDLAELRGPSTEVLDLTGRTILPGFQDSHVHPPAGGWQMMMCNLSSCRTVEDYLETIARFAAEHPDHEWIRGGGWSMALFPGGNPRAEDIDKVVADRPVFLESADGHSTWVNSAALSRAGITADTPDPADGVITRDRAGNPTGTLHEGSANLVRAFTPDISQDDLDSALLVAQRYLHSLGITAWQDAIVGSDSWGRTLDVYIRAAESGALTARVVGAQWWERHQGEEQIERFIQNRARASVGRFRATSVKIMQDGIVENGTAAFLEPYLDPCTSGQECHHDPGNRGISMVDPDRLPGYVTKLDEEGFQVHFHAIGDRAVREALDSFQAARAANGANDNRHHIAHIQVVHPDDIPRFAALDVIANGQPLWAAYDDQMVELAMPVLGEQRSAQQYPFASLLRSGARLAFGSDWSVSTPDPTEEMAIAVNRSMSNATADDIGAARGGEVFSPDECLNLEQAIHAFTMGAAYVNHLDDVTGSLTPGKYADIAVLDRDIFDRGQGRIEQTEVILTLVEGQAVFSADSVGLAPP